MKWVGVVLFMACMLMVGGIIYRASVSKSKKNIELPSHTVSSITPIAPFTPTLAPLSHIEKKMLFVPEWTIGKEKIDNHDIDTVVYFGISANEQGIDRNDPGYQKISSFFSATDITQRRFLALRMIDSDMNAKILKDKKLQEKIIKETIDVVKQYSFDGIVLDLEHSALSFETVVMQINDFYTLFYIWTQNNSVPFYVTLFGDVFFRIRPYDVKTIAEHSDQIIVMAYDFHKANGDPGPNFPLLGHEIYGYDFQMMIDDFLKIVPKEKITVVFGLFGYDWILDSQGRSKQPAKALTLNEINNKFLTTCKLQNCLVARDEKSSETKVSYTEKKSETHIVWFEDMQSVKKKIKYLELKGITSIGYWAYSYF